LCAIRFPLAHEFRRAMADVRFPPGELALAAFGQIRPLSLRTIRHII
jgi:hypothetical protein